MEVRYQNLSEHVNGLYMNLKEEFDMKLNSNNRQYEEKMSNLYEECMEVVQEKKKTMEDISRFKKVTDENNETLLQVNSKQF